MTEYLQQTKSLLIMQKELGHRNVKCINCFDIFLDFVLLDAFNEVKQPPSSIKAVL